jgi:excisionase family DNA binding protein
VKTDQTSTLPQLLSVEALAARWSLKPQTVREWARTGKLPGFKIGDVWMFDEVELGEWLKARRNGGASG